MPATSRAHSDASSQDGTELPDMRVLRRRVGARWGERGWWSWAGICGLRGHTLATMGDSGNSGRLYLGGAPKSLQMVTAAMKLKDACSLEEKP